MLTISIAKLIWATENQTKLDAYDPPAKKTALTIRELAIIIPVAI